MGVQRETMWPEQVLALVLAATTLTVGLLAWSGFWAGFSLFSVTEDAHATRGRLLTAAFVVGTAAPFVCAIVAYTRGLAALVVLNVVLLLLTLSVGAVSTLRFAPDAPPPEQPPAHDCRVHSGSDNTCPGG